MNVQHLVTMANEIGAFFIAEAGEQEAPQAIALHIAKYWEPRMRAQIIAHAETGAEGLTPVAAAAVRLLKPVALRAPISTAGHA